MEFAKAVVLSALVEVIVELVLLMELVLMVLIVVACKITMHILIILQVQNYRYPPNAECKEEEI